MVIRLCIFLTLLASCISANESCTSAEIARDNLKKLATANNELAVNLLRQLCSKGRTENVFFSPLSISSAFGMLFYGTRGETAAELRSTLGYEKADLPDELVHATFKHFLREVSTSANSSAYILNIANAILVDKNLELVPGYKDEVEDLYQASFRNVDFFKDSAVVLNDINDWVKCKTNGMIETLLNDLSPMTVMVLLNAVYFKGKWKIPFEPNKTRQEIFYNGGAVSGAREVPMMRTQNNFRYMETENFQALELPYKSDSISMLVLLPNARDGLYTIKEQLTPEMMRATQNQLRDTQVSVFFPKFKFDYSKELSQEISNMGAKRIFSATSADFSGMSPKSQGLWVTDVFHKAVIEVNEEGSEAAAVTGIVTNRSKKYMTLFKADHPFLFLIVERASGLIMFMGLVSEL